MTFGIECVIKEIARTCLHLYELVKGGAFYSAHSISLSIKREFILICEINEQELEPRITLEQYRNICPTDM